MGRDVYFLRSQSKPQSLSSRLAFENKIKLGLGNSKLEYHEIYAYYEDLLQKKVIKYCGTCSSRPLDERRAKYFEKMIQLHLTTGATYFQPFNDQYKTYCELVYIDTHHSLREMRCKNAIESIILDRHTQSAE